LSDFIPVCLSGLGNWPAANRPNSEDRGRRHFDGRKKCKRSISATSSLAVLSACENGPGGSGMAAEGLLGLQTFRFRWAGARTTVSKPVERLMTARPAPLMERFYSQPMGERPLEARSAARGATVDAPRGSAPRRSTATLATAQPEPELKNIAAVLLWPRFILSGDWH